MSTKVILEKNIRKIVRNYILENVNIDEPKENKERCLTTNTIPLEEIVGDNNEYSSYVGKLNKRNGGISGMIDALDILKTLRLHNDISDKGEHISYELLNHLNKFRNKKYFDETNSGCSSAMDKVLELYKENEHGEELVKDIEKVLKHQDPSPRAKEYLKRCLFVIKGK
jgi:hypothetical protein